MLNAYPWQQEQWSRLEAAIRGRRLAHALLLSGPEGLGKDHFATVLAAGLLCEQADVISACGECRGCRLFQSANHPDFVRLEPEAPGKAIRVELIRELIETLQLHSQYGRHKVALISPAEAMNRSAANTLLKTLEEPPPDSILILVCNRPSQLPVTLRSRCQQISFGGAAGGETLDWLGRQLEGDAGRAGELLTLSQNRPLLALRLHEEGVLDHQSAIVDDLGGLARKDLDAVATAHRWLEFGTGTVLQWLLMFIPVMTRVKLGIGENGHGRLGQGLQALAEGLDLLALLKWYDIVLSNYRAATGPYNLNNQGLLEEVIVSWQELTQANRRSRR